jgi:leucine dehydrogenase
VSPASPDAIYAQPVDVFAPCALGGILNDATIPLLQASIVAGAANNQLDESRHAQMLVDRGILYAPDYLINAGGMLSASRDILHDESEEELMRRVRRIYTTALHVFVTADEIERTTADVADSLAQAQLAGAAASPDDLVYSGIEGIWAS